MEGNAYELINMRVSFHFLLYFLSTIKIKRIQI